MFFLLLIMLVAIIAGVTTTATTTTPAPSSSASVSAIAQEVADVACPYAMLHGYGCPIPTTEMKKEKKHLGGIINSIRHNLTTSEADASSPTCTYGDTTTNSMCMGGDGKPKITQWSLGVPLGVGFDSTTMKVQLPFFFPTGTSKQVFDVSMEHQTYKTIDDYVGSLSPTAKKALVTGALSPDLGKVYSTYFGSYSYMHRTTQVDIITEATLEASPTMLPQVEMMLERVLPDEYDETVYSEFISSWGTDVITSAGIGGAIEQLLSVKSCYGSGGDADLENEAQILLGIKTVQGHTGEKLNSQFEKYTESYSLEMYGGNIEYSKPSDWKKRQLSIAESPVLIKINTMVPIWQYLKENSTKRQTLKTAIENYKSNAITKRKTELKKQMDDQQFHVSALSSVELSAFNPTFHAANKVCDHCLIGKCWCGHHCDWYNAGFCINSGCGTGCGAQSTTYLGTAAATQSMTRGQSQKMSPPGTDSACLCQNYGGYGGQNHFPFNSQDVTVTCSIDANGKVRATNVQIENDGHSGGSTSSADGDTVDSGCSIATRTIADPSWGMHHGGGCGNSGTGGSSGSIIAKGYCCLDRTVTRAYTVAGCQGSYGIGQCPGFH